MSSPLWMNKTIKIENKPVFYEDWFRKGICFVNDIMSEDGKFLSIDQLETEFNISKNIMKFNSTISAVKHAGKQNVYNSYKLLTPFIPSFVKTILKSKWGTKDMYLLLIRNNIVSNGQKKWEEILALGLDEMKWREIFKLPFIVAQNTKLQWLQYRINQRILGTNKFLYKI